MSQNRIYIIYMQEYFEAYEHKKQFYESIFHKIFSGIVLLGNINLTMKAFSKDKESNKLPVKSMH